MRGVVMPEYPVCIVHKGLVPCTGILRPDNPSLLTGRKKHSKWERQCLVNFFPNHGVAWEQRVDQYDAIVGFLIMPIFRIQAKNPFISCMVILVQFFSRVGTLPTLLLITPVGFCHHEGKDHVCEETMDVSNRRRIRRRDMLTSRQFLELERKGETLFR
jgi:hypothetical protein